MAGGAPAIKAAVQFAKAGTTAQKASVVKEIAMGMGLGLICGVAFKVCLPFGVFRKRARFSSPSSSRGRKFGDCAELAADRSRKASCF